MNAFAASVNAGICVPGSGLPVVEASPDGQAKTTVLYIGDTVSNLAVMEMIFETCRPHWQLVMADCGRTGLAQARQIRPDFILLDLQLPDLNGAMVLAELRKDALTSAIPVVILTADATAASCKLLGSLGAGDCIVKPFGLDDLLRRLDRMPPGLAVAC